MSEAVETAREVGERTGRAPLVVVPFVPRNAPGRTKVRNLGPSAPASEPVDPVGVVEAEGAEGSTVPGGTAEPTSGDGGNTTGRSAATTARDDAPPGTPMPSPAIPTATALPKPPHAEAPTVLLDLRDGRHRDAGAQGGPSAKKSWRRRPPSTPQTGRTANASLSGLEARAISAWFGDHKVLNHVSLTMKAGRVTALIGPSGCGKSTFLRILNRMHELIPGASLAGEVLLNGADIYDPGRKLTDARRQIGMVFQKPNPFPAMTVYDNVLAGLKLTGTRTDQATKDRLVEECLTKAGLWKEVRDRLRQPGGALSGGQQQRLCIGRALAIRPRVLLMDEPCSALDPTSTRRIEETIAELASEVTIVIVTHNMQQAARVSDECAFFLAEQGTPGYIVEHGATTAMFSSPRDPRTADYVAGRFG